MNPKDDREVHKGKSRGVVSVHGRYPVTPGLGEDTYSITNRVKIKLPPKCAVNKKDPGRIRQEFF